MRRGCPYHCNSEKREKQEDPGDEVVFFLSLVTIPGVFASQPSFFGEDNTDRTPLCAAAM